ncbi:MAG TPA: hypothetical protein DCY74_00020 [Clostridiales bacterium]|jgi:hypothetical protein|nr:hypothetical protein [Clostridiales bacterium]
MKKITTVILLILLCLASCDAEEEGCNITVPDTEVDIMTLSLTENAVFFTEDNVKTLLTFPDSGILFHGTTRAGIPYEGDVYYPKGLLETDKDVKARFFRETNTLSYENGDVYTGDTINLIRHGKGKLTCADGMVYEGDFVNDSITGTGKFLYANGDTYEGDVANSKRQGIGLYTWKESNDRYYGNFSHDVRAGKGFYTYANGDVFDGTYENGIKKEGVMTWANGDTFWGTYENDCRLKGTMTWANGDTYTGNFQNNLMHGQGIYVWAETGERYSGTFVNGAIVK